MNRTFKEELNMKINVQKQNYFYEEEYNAKKRERIDDEQEIKQVDELTY